MPIAGCMLLAACGGTSEPTSTSAEQTSRSAPPTVSPSDLERLLLPEPDVESLMGATDLTAHGTDTKLRATEVDPSDCTSAMGPASIEAYGGSNWIATRAQHLQSEKPMQLKVQQAVVSFETPDAADEFYSRAIDNWTSCVGRYVTYRGENSDRGWTLGDVGETDGVATLAAHLEGGDGWECQRGLTTKSNVIVDVRVCARGVGDKGARVAEAIAARIGA